jgi:DNA-binding transcriptional ArsR family regulator
MEQRKNTVTDVGRLKAFAHPLRLRLYYALSAEEVATASRLAEMVDESVALVSYHLRQLADQGFVEEATGHGTDGRERWWRTVANSFSWSANDFADPAGRVVASTVKREMVAHQVSRIGEFEDTQAAWGAAWVEAAFSSDSLLRLTAAELDRMHEELQAVVRRWHEHGRSTTRDEAEQPEHVMVLMHGFPFTP